MFFDKKYDRRKEQYLREMIDFSRKMGFIAPDFFPIKGRLFLVDYNMGKTTPIMEVSTPAKKDCINDKIFNIKLKELREKIKEAKYEIDSRQS